MSIREQAKTELAAVNFGDDDSRVMLEILDKFFDQWDSGGAVAVASDVLARLIKGQPLAPLTGDDAEWFDVSEMTGRPNCWQNKRCSSVFQEEDGEGKVLAYDIDAPSGRKAITFPYYPQTARVRMPIYEIDASTETKGDAPASEP